MMSRILIGSQDATPSMSPQKAGYAYFLTGGNVKEYRKLAYSLSM